MEVGRPPGESRGGRTRNRRRRRRRGGWGLGEDKKTAPLEVTSNPAEGALKVRPLSSSCVPAFKSVPAAAAAPAAPAAGERANHLACDLFFWQSFVPDRQSSEQAAKEEEEEVDTSPGFGTAPHSSTERSAQESDPVRPVSPLRSRSPFFFFEDSWIFPGCFPVHRDINNAQRELPSFELER